MNALLRSGSLRAVEWVLTECYKRGHITFLENSLKDMATDKSAATFALVMVAIDLWRQHNPKEDLFNHIIYDNLDVRVLYNFIDEALNDPSTHFETDVALAFYGKVSANRIQAWRRENPRRSARLAAKRAAKC